MPRSLTGPIDLRSISLQDSKLPFGALPIANELPLVTRSIFPPSGDLFPSIVHLLSVLFLFLNHSTYLNDLLG